MSEESTKPKVFALAGNPNCGKTTIFNALTGLRQKVANYPGVTVERKEGVFFGQHGEKFRLIDLPGAYSLSAKSPDEEIMRDVLLGRRADTPKPDVVICVIDASNAERHLYLATQILELGLPAIIVLNMTDIAESRGIEFDPAKLSDLLGVPVVAMQASTRKGIDKLRIAISSADLSPSHHHVPLPEELAVVLEGDGKVFNRSAIYEPGSVHHANRADWEDKLIANRYGAIREICEGTSCQVDPNKPNRTEQIDRVALHWLGGPLIALTIMSAVFFLIFSVATIPMDLIDGLFGWLSGLIRDAMPEGDLRDLITEGVIAGVGGVVIFLPQILILFFFIGLMESTGYLPRLAFMLDRAMTAVGLSGKSFVPLLSSYACAVPGIMGARTVEDPKDRLVTILVAPLTSCSARLPVYAILIFVLVPAAAGGNTLAMVPWLLGLYALGTIGVIAFSWIFNRLLKRGEKSSNIMELPTYKRPSFAEIAIYLWQRAKIFLKRAGTIILGLSIVLWAMQTYPKAEELSQAEQQEQSIAGRMGHFIEPVIEPLGYDWKIGIGLIASFAAREVFVSAMSVTYAVEADEEEEQTRQLLARFQDAKRPDGTKVFTPLTCMSLLVFYVFAMQCLSTVAVVRRETNSWKWPLFQIGYMTATAYLAALIVYQGGKLFGFS